jgi:hypothetical protein
MKRSSAPFVSSVPAIRTTDGPDGSNGGLGAGVGSSLAELAEAIRALDSIRALATGCDHRVGGVGLET